MHPATLGFWYLADLSNSAEGAAAWQPQLHCLSSWPSYIYSLTPPLDLQRLPVRCLYHKPCPEQTGDSDSQCVAEQYDFCAAFCLSPPQSLTGLLGRAADNVTAQGVDCAGHLAPAAGAVLPALHSFCQIGKTTKTSC